MSQHLCRCARVRRGGVRGGDARVTEDHRTLGAAGYGMGFLTDVCVLGDGSVTCGATNGTVVLLDCADGKAKQQVKVHSTAAVTALAFDASTASLFAGLSNGEVVAVPVSVSGDAIMENEQE